MMHANLERFRAKLVWMVHRHVLVHYRKRNTGKRLGLISSHSPAMIVLAAYLWCAYLPSQSKCLLVEFSALLRSCSLDICMCILAQCFRGVCFESVFKEKTMWMSASMHVTLSECIRSHFQLTMNFKPHKRLFANANDRAQNSASSRRSKDA